MREKYMLQSFINKIDQSYFMVGEKTTTTAGYRKMQMQQLDRNNI